MTRKRLTNRYDADTAKQRKIANFYYRNAIKVYCSGSGMKKWLFHSKGAAVAAARFNFRSKFARRGYNKIRLARAYYCRACGGWHLTKMNKREWEARKEELARRKEQWKRYKDEGKREA